MVWAASLNVVAATNQLKLYLTPVSASLTTGNSASFQIRLNKQTTSKVDYVNAELKYPVSLLEATAVSKSGSHFSTNGGPSVSINNSTGVIVVNGQGASLGTPADVLVATVTFRTRATGSASVAFTTNSQSGNLLGANNVKNYLDSTAGAVLTITTPPSTSPPPTSTKPTPTTPPPTTQPPASTETTPTETTDPVITNTQTSPTDVTQQTTTTSPTVTQKQTSQQTSLGRYWPWALGMVVLIALGAVVFYITKKRHSSEPQLVLSPDITEEPDTGLPTQDDATVEGGTFSSYQSVVDAEPMSTDAFTAAPEQVAVAQPEPVAAEQPVATGQVEVEGVVIEPLDPHMPSPLVQSSMAAPEPPTPQPIVDVIAPVVVATPVANSPVYAEASSQVAVPVVPQSVQQPVSPAVIPDVTPPPQPEATPAQPDDIPDMFDIGEARLKAEGLTDRIQVGATR